jgi:hypothetical protein
VLPASSLAANPVLTISKPANNEYINQTMPVIDGTTNETGLSMITVRVYAGSHAEGTVVSQVTIVPTLPAWSAALTATLAQGRYTVQAEQVTASDAVGLSPTVSFVLDTTAPYVSLNPIASPTDVATPQLSGAGGTAEGDLKSVTVTIHQGATTSGTVVEQSAVPVSAGSWSYAVPHLADGQYTAQATQLDEAGNLGTSETETFTVDTTPPALTMSSPAAGSVLSSSTPTLRGTAGSATGDLQFVTVKLYAGATATGTPVQQVTLSSAEWSSGHVGLALKDGTYTALSEQSDQAGNIGKSQATFTIEAAPPPVTLGLPGAVVREGLPATGAKPSFAGSAGAAPEGNSIVVSIYAGEQASGKVVQTLNAQASAESWSVAATTALPEGTYSAVAEQEDANYFGHNGASPKVVFRVITTPPVVTIHAPGPVTGTAVGLSGTAGDSEGDQAQVTLTLYAGSKATGPPLQTLIAPVTGGAWTGAFAGLKPGSYTALAQQSDDFGNTGQGQATFTLEGSPPPVTLSLPGAVVREGLQGTGAKPSFAGSAGAAAEDGTSIVVHIYAGEQASGTPVQTLDAQASAGSWSATATTALAEGTYSAVAEQLDEAFFGHNGLSPKVVFRVITTPPVVTIGAPGPVTGTAVSLSGTASESEGDQGQVTVTLYAGSEVTPTPLQTLIAPVTDGAWTGAFAGLTPGTYTALAQQSDDFGNTGDSKLATFTITAAVHSAGSPAPSATPATSTPVAAFEWFPHQPQVGEAVSLISTSTDLDSAITSYSWALSPAAAFKAGEVMLHTSFAEAGDQHVRLRISDALGHSALVEQTIDVVPAVAGLIDPFPVVRIAGTDASHSVHLRLVSVLAPIGTQVTVLCHGRGCPARVRSFRATAPAGKPGLAFLALKHYERTWRAGTILQIEVAKSGEYGKYTRLEILAGRLPRRVDECLSPTGSPVACPD